MLHRFHYVDSVHKFRKFLYMKLYRRRRSRDQKKSILKFFFTRFWKLNREKAKYKWANTRNYNNNNSSNCERYQENEMKAFDIQYWSRSAILSCNVCQTDIPARSISRMSLVKRGISFLFSFISFITGTDNIFSRSFHFLPDHFVCVSFLCVKMKKPLNTKYKKRKNGQTRRATKFFRKKYFEKKDLSSYNRYRPWLA